MKRRWVEAFCISGAIGKALHSEAHLHTSVQRLSSNDWDFIHWFRLLHTGCDTTLYGNQKKLARSLQLRTCNRKVTTKGMPIWHFGRYVDTLILVIADMPILPIFSYNILVLKRHGNKETVAVKKWFPIPDERGVCLIGGVPHPLKSSSCRAVFLQALTAGTRNVRTPPYCGGPFTWDDVAWCSNCCLQMLNTTHFSVTLYLRRS